MKSAMYSEYAEQYDQAVQDNIYNAHFERPSLQALLPEIRGLNVLDLGCGTGVYAQYLLDQGADAVTCIDYSEAMVDLVRSKLGEKVTAYAQDISLGLPQEETGSYDLIICPLVLHYLEDLNPLFQDVYRVLKPGGVMVFSMHHPLADFEYSQTGNYFDRELVTQEWDTVGKPLEVKFYRRSLSELTDAITSSGLVITRISEGQVSDKVKELSESAYNFLSRNPNFIFVRCQK
ncbi:class I SAM-dependent DNA methyltransferase [Parendozoicomonas haliclonae]|uniref:Malonyl-[acyl-carrier protein] O-methyltransferase n=2 Tax=Parendozoicomonas haliclonae TaxID=1960125 RepID=A0A1X7AQ09_9GAMM|nr:class I SAM-dependent methyltransferase [Parendozoicomonas haliclonae]SMA50179.1 Malonyl-[acyl-carrier protein] O-methyltransferase [Parendozoicomonas haliclonae]